MRLNYYFMGIEKGEGGREGKQRHVNLCGDLTVEGKQKGGGGFSGFSLFA
jgi:hypothetical protein